MCVLACCLNVATQTGNGGEIMHHEDFGFFNIWTFLRACRQNVKFVSFVRVFELVSGHTGQAGHTGHTGHTGPTGHTGHTGHTGQNVK